jgi:hypothetical protein
MDQKLMKKHQWEDPKNIKNIGWNYNTQIGFS